MTSLLFPRLRHENLVDMVGYSCDDHCPCLVYAYMSNGSLLDRLACLVSLVHTYHSPHAISVAHTHIYIYIYISGVRWLSGKGSGLVI